MIMVVTQSIFKLGPPDLHGSKSRSYLWYVDYNNNYNDDDNDGDDDYSCNSVNF